MKYLERCTSTRAGASSKYLEMIQYAPLFFRDPIPRRRVTPRRADRRAPRTRDMSAVVGFIKETHEDAVVKVGKNVAIAALLLNIFFPGIGTLVACVVADKTVAGSSVSRACG